MVAIMACHTERPTAIRELPTCQFERQIWLMAQKEMKASFPHCRREGGMGRISSLIHGEEDVCEVVGTWRYVRREEVFMMGEKFEIF